ncbi:G-type lectin S-receptor-like serine/threonine-protein kinase [Artemisia annua]|uniref:G-type lectin S-receptor-like serine/threonine-protein kinase n=1 Tax=Artemisia annua TaxID=35608 RepID=A0A2U1LG63_ARTAN|nr:G-type lectin S-receptor-like serine/threonine-protein kinase [Artemisia annua]
MYTIHPKEDEKGKGSRRKSFVDKDHLDLPFFSLSTLSIATNDFSTNNKLGEGGFGPVYKHLYFETYALSFYKTWDVQYVLCKVFQLQSTIIKDEQRKILLVCVDFPIAVDARQTRQILTTLSDEVDSS